MTIRQHMIRLRRTPQITSGCQVLNLPCSRRRCVANPSPCQGPCRLLTQAYPPSNRDPSSSTRGIWLERSASGRRACSWFVDYSATCSEFRLCAGLSRWLRDRFRVLHQPGTTSKVTILVRANKAQQTIWRCEGLRAQYNR